MRFWAVSLSRGEFGVLGICDLVLFSGCSRVKLLNLVFSELEFCGFCDFGGLVAIRFFGVGIGGICVEFVIWVGSLG